MKIESYKYPKSSFLSVDKDLATIIDRIFENERLQKLLYYTTPDCLERPKLTEDEVVSMFGRNIKITPKLEIDDKVLNYIYIHFNHFMPSLNPEFRDNTLEFDIICHADQWRLNGIALRPFKIMAEIDSMFNDSKMSGIGTLQFLQAYEISLTNELQGYCLTYQAYHGEGDDQKNAYDPKEEASIIENFNKMFNS